MAVVVDDDVDVKAADQPQENHNKDDLAVQLQDRLTLDDDVLEHQLVVQVQYSNVDLMACSEAHVELQVD